MVSVLFINPPNVPFSGREILIEPIDVLGLATYAQSRGNRVRIIDMDALQIRAEGFLAFLQNSTPDFVVIPFDYHIPLFTSAAAEEIRKVLALCASHKIRVILGGKPVTYRTEQFITDRRTVAIHGEMEESLKLLLSLDDWSEENLREVPGISFMDGKSLRRTALRKTVIPLDSLPIPDRSLVDLHNYVDVRTMLTSRGCIAKCGFCPVPGFWGHWRERSPEKVVEEIQYLGSSVGARKILFLDDNATVKPSRMRRISELLLQNDIQVALGCLGTVADFDENTVQLMFKAGFRWIHYGAESGSQAVLDSLKKKITVDQVRQATVKSKKAGLRVRTSWILDAPGADEHSIDESLKLMLDTEPDEIRLHFLSLRDGSEIAQVFQGKDSEQSIHSAFSHTGLSRIPIDTLRTKLERLIETLSGRGYCLVKDLSDYAKVDLSAAPRFISLCPLRYGVGWAP